MAYTKNYLMVAFLTLLAAPFAFYAIDRGLRISDLQEQISSRLFHPDAQIPSWGLYAHMVTGGIITVLAPLQLLQVVRDRAATLHRISGYLIATASIITALAGLFYIGAMGTIGGIWMSLGFSLYGVLMLWTVVRTVGLARCRDPHHQPWAERLVILALASWLYRVHYGIWEILTGGAGTSPDFSGPFDRAQVFAFYVPYLLVHAWWRARNPPRAWR